jgi:hypothetical protein
VIAFTEVIARIAVHQASPSTSPRTISAALVAASATRAAGRAMRVPAAA